MTMKWQHLGILALGTAFAIPASAAAQSSTPTFTKDIAPIFQEKCEACHRPESIAPMSLVTYEEARPWARSIRGFDVISRANNHAADYDVMGLLATSRVLADAGLLHAGAGLHLGEASAPAIFGSGARRVAVFAVATSFAPEARATAETSELAGRPGVHALRYDADVIVDSATYETLRQSVQALGAGPPPGDQELEMFGTRIRKGTAVSVTFRVNEDDQARVLDDIARARAAGQVVVLSVHSHEPSNASEEPAAFVRDFARLAIDRGASLIVGHGPHRVRGIERYGDGVILYSLGNFLYQSAAVDFRAADMFDASTDLYGVALGALRPESGRADLYERPEWWRGLVAVVDIEETGRVNEVRLHPLTLGADRPLAERGVPALARDDDARELLAELGRLSKSLGTEMELSGSSGLVSR